MLRGARTLFIYPKTSLSGTACARMIQLCGGEGSCRTDKSRMRTLLYQDRLLSLNILWYPAEVLYIVNALAGAKEA